MWQTAADPSTPQTPATGGAGVEGAPGSLTPVRMSSAGSNMSGGGSPTPNVTQQRLEQLRLEVRPESTTGGRKWRRVRLKADVSLMRGRRRASARRRCRCGRTDTWRRYDPSLYIYFVRPAWIKFVIRLWKAQGALSSDSSAAVCLYVCQAMSFLREAKGLDAELARLMRRGSSRVRQPAFPLCVYGQM